MKKVREEEGYERGFYKFVRFFFYILWQFLITRNPSIEHDNQLVTTILESKDLTSITHAMLFGKLREYEMDMTRMDEKEAKERKSKGL